MSTLKVNEVRHLSNTGSANIVLESNSNINLQTTGTKALSVDGTLTVTGLTTLNGDTVVGNATTDTVSLISTISGFNNFSGFTGEVRMYAGNAAGNAPPAGWLYCNGNSIALDSTTSNESWEASSSAANHQGSIYQALFNLLKESNDWDNASGAVWGTNKVRLPDFRSRSPVGVGTGAANTIGNGADSVALTVRALGDTGGGQSHTLVTGEIPAHNHAATSGSSVTGSTATTTLDIGAYVPNHVHTQAHTHNSAAHVHSGSSLSTSDPGNHNHSNGSYNLLLKNNGTETVQYVDNSSEPNLIRSGAIQAAGAHTHSISGNTGSTTPGVTGGVNTANTGNPTSATTAIAFTEADHTGSTPLATTALSSSAHTHAIPATNTGGGGAHTILSPIIAVNYIIKV